MTLEKQTIVGKIACVLKDTRTGKKRVVVAGNLVTNDGDLYYAEVARAALSNSVTADFGGTNGRIVVLNSTGNTPVKTSNYSDIGAAVGSGNPKAFTAGYPRNDDPDSDNPNAASDTLTYATQFTTAEANGTIDRVAIHLSTASNSDPILMYAAFTQFTKTSNDTLKVFVNHNFLGA